MRKRGMEYSNPSRMRPSSAR